MRPTTIVTIVTGVILALGAIALGVFAFVERGHGKPWFFWLAPLLVIGFAGAVGNLIAQYYTRVGKYEIKGRPRQ